MNKQNTVTRDQLIQKYIDWYMSEATLAELQDAVAQQMWDDLSDIPDNELVKEIKYYAPELTENITLSI